MDQPRFSTLTAADGTTLRKVLWKAQAAKRGVVLLLHGRVEFIEKYAETATALTARGFDVVSFDWRGQGLSDGRNLSNRQRHHLDDFTTLVEDLESVVAAVTAKNPDIPLVLLAHSMGALVATLSLARHPTRFKAAILSAPMWGIITKPWPRWAARALARVATYEGFGLRYAFGQHDHNPAEAAFTPDNPLTSDPARYAVMHQHTAANPDLLLGGVSFGWLDAAFRAMAAATRAPLETVTTPVLVLSAPGDAVVDATNHPALTKRFANGRLAEFPDGRHELLMESDLIRDRVWTEIDRLLDAAVPVSPG